jgi:mannose-1-phosphate guanylyltransferase
MTDDSGRVTDWREPTEAEKKQIAAGRGCETHGSDMINAGIYVLERGLIERIPAGRMVSIERETYPAAIVDGLRVFAFAPQGYWLDIGSPRQYLDANLAVIAGKVATDLAASPQSDSAVVMEGAVVENTVIGPDCVVMEGAEIRDSLLLESVGIGAGVQVSGSILDTGCAVEDSSVIRDGAVLGSGSRVTRGSLC